MSPDKLVYAGHESALEDRVTAYLRDRLPKWSVETVTSTELLDRRPFDNLACLVYQTDPDGPAPSAVVESVRSDRPGVPVVLFLFSPSEVSLEKTLSADRTAVVRRTDEAEDLRVLLNRVEGLLKREAQSRKLADARTRFETLFENFTQPIVEVEFDGDTPVVQRVNRAFESVFGYEAPEIRGNSLDDYIVPPDSHEEAREINSRVLDGDMFSIEATRETTDGTREFLLKNAVYPDMPGEFAMYVDITERKRREEALQRQNERLDQFASMVSHDLRNPLNVAQLKADRLVREDGDETASDLKDALVRMETIIDEVLQLARAGQTIETTEQCLLGPLVQEAWRNVRSEGADLVVGLDSATVEADVTRLTQVFENLFRNAVEHNEPPLVVRVDTLETGDGFAVEDDGQGIPPADRRKVFDQGYTTGGSGNGLGLQIVDDIVDAHGWRIRVTESEAGGARFEVETE